MIWQFSVPSIGTVQVDLTNPLADIRLRRRIKQLNASQKGQLMDAAKSLLQILNDACALEEPLQDDEGET